jgi:hypothetical protein
MAAAADVMAGIAGLGVPWWAWTALVLMILWGLLAPAGEEGPSEFDERMARLHDRYGVAGTDRAT